MSIQSNNASAIILKDNVVKGGRQWQYGTLRSEDASLNCTFKLLVSIGLSKSQTVCQYFDIMGYIAKDYVDAGPLDGCSEMNKRWTLQGRLYMIDEMQFIKRGTRS